MASQRRIAWYLLFTALLLYLPMPFLARKVMFVDGLWYATFAHNMSQGVGSFWHPVLTNTAFSSFYAHPPLVFGIESLFFSVLGSSGWVERLYSLFTLLATAALIRALWNCIFPANTSERRLFWLPLILWITVEDVYRMYPNNLLECTMTLFTTGAVYLLLRCSQSYYTWCTSVIAGSCVWLAMLCKGPVGMFPLAFWLCHYLAFRKLSLSDTWQRTLHMVVGTVGAAVITFWLWPEAVHYFHEYTHIQLWDSLSGITNENRRGHHLHILKQFILHNILGIGLLIIGYVLHRSVFVKHIRWLIFLLLLGATASVPLTLSLKQASYYLIPSLPFYHIAFVLVWASPLVNLLSKLSFRTTSILNAFFGLGALVGLILFVHAVYDAPTPVVALNAKLITEQMGNDQVIGYIGEKGDTSVTLLHCYLMRHHFVSLDAQHPFDHSGLLTPADTGFLYESYVPLDIPLQGHKLWLKR